MRLPRFTLVHRRRAAPAVARAARRPPPAPRAPAAAAIAVRVGLWDLGANLGRLPGLVAVLNRAQGALVFFETMAALPAGMVSRPERVRAWCRERRGQMRLPGLEPNVIAEDFYARADPVRRELGLDWLIGITPRRITGEQDGRLLWNVLSARRRRLLLVSSHGLRERAALGGAPFERAVGERALAALLAALHPRLVPLARRSAVAALADALGGYAADGGAP
jgi:hypothetical protein